MDKLDFILMKQRNLKKDGTGYFLINLVKNFSRTFFDKDFS
jgi:hypothetical protein